MSFLNELVDGVASDVLSAVTERLSYTAASKLIETCCQELGWAIDERPSPGRIALHFNDRVNVTLTKARKRRCMRAETCARSRSSPSAMAAFA